MEDIPEIWGLWDYINDIERKWLKKGQELVENMISDDS